MDLLKYSKAIEYKGCYRGIYWSIKNWSFAGAEPFDKWNYYLNLFLNQIEDTELAEKMWPEDKVYDWGTVPDYYSLPIVHDIAMHGGITYCKKHENCGNLGRNIEIGCDYSHYGDEGRNYNLDYLLFDVKNSIDLFHENCLYKVRCHLFGKCYLESEGEYTNDTFISFEGREEWKVKYPDSKRFEKIEEIG